MINYVVWLRVWSRVRREKLLESVTGNVIVIQALSFDANVYNAVSARKSRNNFKPPPPLPRDIADIARIVADIARIAPVNLRVKAANARNIANIARIGGKIARSIANIPCNLANNARNITSIARDFTNIPRVGGSNPPTDSVHAQTYRNNRQPPHLSVMDC